MSIRLNSKEQEEIVVNNLALVHYCVKRLNVEHSQYQDIVSVGTIGLIRAAKTFDNSKGIKFTSYASKCIYNEISVYFRNENIHSKNISLYTPIINNSNNEKDFTYIDIISNQKSFTEKIELKDMAIRGINIILNVLNQREKLIMLYRISGMKMHCVAKIFNTTKANISRIEIRLRKILKLYFDNPKPYKEIYKIDIINDFYVIKVSSEIIKNFDNIIEKFFQNNSLSEELVNFNIVYNQNEVIIKTPAYKEYFYLIAEIIRQIEDLSEKRVN